MHNADPMINGATEYYIVDSEDGVMDYNVGIQLSDPLSDLLPILNSETVDQQLSDLSRQNLVQQHGPPERNPFSGKYEFQVEINSSDIHKKRYLYSNKLSRIYVDMDMDFPIQFRWRGPAHMFVRATCVFAEPAQAEKRVERCLNHIHSNPHMDPVVRNNVLHSSRPPGTAGIQYCGRPEAQDSWLSVLASLHKPGAEVSHAYRFTCKNSCATGINRRSILIIFALEDQNGVVHGRQTVGARVCACPRRDMRKDEESEGVPRGKRNSTCLPPPTLPPPKMKREEMDDGIIDLNLQLTSPAAAILGVEVMIKMEQQAFESRRDPRTSDVIAALKLRQQELKDRYPEHAE